MYSYPYIQAYKQARTQISLHWAGQDLEDSVYYGG